MLSGRVFVSDRRLAADPAASSLQTGRLRVHAKGFSEPTGLAAVGATLYVADFHAGLVRKVSPAGRVTTLARLPQVTAVAASARHGVYAVTLDGVLARDLPPPEWSPAFASGSIARTESPSTGPAELLIGEDSRRVRRVDRRTGRAELVVDGVDTNKIAVARDGSCFSPARP